MAAYGKLIMFRRPASHPTWGCGHARDVLNPATLIQLALACLMVGGGASLSFLPGSHRRPRPEAPARAAGPEERLVELRAGVVCHFGDCRAVLETLGLDRDRTVVITDPPWPEAPPDLLAEWEVEDCIGLLRETFAICARVARRLIVVLGCSSDPRVLAVPESMPFVRACWLRLALPSPRGTILNSGDIAYIFGSREAGEGMTLIPGEVTASTPRARENAGASMHPTARRDEHMRWLVRHGSQPGDTVVDPFCGSATTLVAAADAGRRAIGIEKSSRYLPAMRERFRQQSLITTPGAS